VTGDLERHYSYFAEAVAAARAAPLSRRKALTAIMLADQMADRLFAASGEDDVLGFRAALAGQSAALRLVFALASSEEGVRLLVEPVPVAVEDHPKLAVEDYMVSLYNDRTVQRVLIAEGDARHDVHEVLDAALKAIEGARR
jgi:hypothetical protein